MASKAINLGAFTASLRRNGKKLTEDDLVLFHKKVSLDALGRVVEKTPVDTGRARANWQVGIDNAPEGEVPIGTDPRGNGLAALTALRPNRVVYISNNVEYIVPLEEGSSNQAPNGMVAVTLEELSQQFGGGA